MSYVIERGIIYLFCIIVLIFLLASCGTAAPPYVCQQGLHESGAAVLICSPIKPEQIGEAPVRLPARPGKPDERT